MSYQVRSIVSGSVKSELCQEYPYLLELARNIHLNPLLAGIVENFKELTGFSYSGHSAIMEKRKRIWQDTGYVLVYFDRRIGLARRLYREYVNRGIETARRLELVGGGFIRSLCGWDKIKRMRKGKECPLLHKF